MASLTEKRNRSILAIIGCVIVNGGSAAVPTPALETGKHAAYSAVEISLCVTIYNFYSSKSITKDGILDFLIKNGIASSSGGGLAFVGTKLGHSALAEMLNFVPIVGWGIKAVLAGSITASIGFACLTVCHRLAQSGELN
ncbi:MAG: hypothetical protein AAFQ80_23235 [Cyanobacteria bacterium J06621_8]